LTALRAINRKVALFAGHVVFDKIGMLKTHEFDGEAIFDGLAASLVRPQFTSSSIDEKTVSCAGLFLPRLEMSGGGERLLDPDIPKRPDVEYGQRALPQPMRMCQWSKGAKCSSAAPFVTSKGQKQQFKLNFRPVFRAAKNAGHEGLMFHQSQRSGSHRPDLGSH